MRIFLSLIFLLSIVNIDGQKTIVIPKFKNINPKDIYPQNTILAAYTAKFDILVSLNSYSNWGPDHNIKVFAYNKSGWYKIEISTDPFYIDTSVHDSTYKIDDSIGKTIWHSLIQNHLFDMNDERSKDMKCHGHSETIKQKNGELIEVSTFHSVEDGGEYEFEIIDKDHYKKLFFNNPEEYNKICRPIQERKWIVNCISIFEKYLGN